MHDVTRTDGSQFNQCMPFYVRPGSIVAGFGALFVPERETLLNTPYLAATIHVLFDALVAKKPLHGSITLWALIRDDHGQYRRVDSREITAAMLTDSTEGFSVSFPNGCDGFVIRNGIDSDLNNITARVSGVPTNTRVLRV